MPPSNIYKELRKVRQWERSAPNRLKSIEEDAVRLDGLLSSLCLEVSEAIEAAERKSAELRSSSVAELPERPIGPCSSPPIVSVRCFANLRCGEWYLPTCSTFRGGKGLPCCSTRLSARALEVLGGAEARIAVSPNVYFKSADSHYGQWQFSAVRLNLQLLEPYLFSEVELTQLSPTTPQLLSIVVDATQQGKRFPDALSKTVPIWCLVVNEVFFYAKQRKCEDEILQVSGSGNSLHIFTTRAREMLPPWVSDSEANSIGLLVPSFIKVLQSQLAMNSQTLRSKGLRRPLKCAWVSAADGETGEEALLNIGRHAVHRSGNVTHDTLVLLCASGDTIKVRPRGGWFYVTGGADDHESWGQGLSPTLFWSHIMDILHPNGSSAPSDSMIQANMEEVIETHALHCRLLAKGSSSNEDITTGANEWYALSPLLFVHCGGAKKDTIQPEARWLIIGEGSDAASSEGKPIVSLVPLGAKILFDPHNKIGLQRAAFALLSMASMLMIEEDVEGASHRPLVLSVAIKEHMPLAVAVAALLMTLMTHPEQPTEIKPLVTIESRLREKNIAQRTEATPAEDVAKGEGISDVLLSLSGCITEAIAARPGGVTKEWIRSCHQRASSLCGGVTAPRSLMQQINQYFLTMDSFGKNSY